MLDILFRPFSFSKWLVVGFSAWLAGLGGCWGSLGYDGPVRGWNSSSGSVSSSSEELSSIGELLENSWARVATAGCLTLLVIGCIAFIVLMLALLWVTSRGKFIFLENVIHNRAQIVEPWTRLRRQGNSLFWFLLAYSGVFLVIVAVLAGFTALSVALGWFNEFSSLQIAVRAVIGLAVGALFLSLMVVLAYVGFFLNAFVVPLMYRYDLDVRAGWARFIGLFRERPVPFLLSGLFVLVLSFGVVMAVLAAGLLTCCLGFLLLMIPYVGTVLLLPIPVLYRSFTVEFLAQFDPDLLASTALPAAVQD